MDIRHPLKDLDQQDDPVGCRDNICAPGSAGPKRTTASGARKAQLNMVREAVLVFNGDVQVEAFSLAEKQGVDVTSEAG